MRMPKCVKKSAPKMGNSTSATINVQVKGCSKDGRVKYSIVDPAVRIGDPFAALRTSRLWEFCSGRNESGRSDTAEPESTRKFIFGCLVVKVVASVKKTSGELGSISDTVIGCGGVVCLHPELPWAWVGLAV